MFGWVKVNGDGEGLECSFLTYVLSVGVCAAMSSGHGLYSIAGANFLRNFLFLKVGRLDPSTLTTYWSYCLTSTTVPVLSHFLGFGPTWF